MTATPDGHLTVDRLALLGFYDDPEPREQGMAATAFNAVAGEELGLALLLHYFNGVGVDAHLLDVPCTTGRRRGHRLDGWIATPELLYQVEVKNWSAHSFGGRRLPVDAPTEVAAKHRQTVWGEYWNGTTFVDPPAAKVLEPMNPPDGHSHVEPLIAFWVPLHPEGDHSPFFSVPVAGGHFDQVHVFSMSSYLRGLDDDALSLPLPCTKVRLGILERVFSSHGGGVQQAHA